jgi:hypothetical protein
VKEGLSQTSSPNPGGIAVWDWFLPAIESDRTVRSSFEGVLQDLAHRVEFVQVLRDRLCDSESPDLDTISQLLKEVRFLKSSLQSRLGILSADRPAAWFRPSIAQSAGPFSQPIAREPMFFSHGAEDIPDIHQELENLWSTRSQPTSRWINSPTIWGLILGLNHRYESICRLHGKHCSGLRLDRLPESLPERLNSPILRGFLQNVRVKALEVRTALDQLYSDMFAASEKLWDSMRRQAEEQRGSRMYRHTETAQRAKDEFRERRQSAARARTILLSQPVLDALAIMRFTELPDLQGLKRRYLELARELHPDHNPGKDDEFKKLGEAYTYLTRRIKPIVQRPS